MIHRSLPSSASKPTVSLASESVNQPSHFGRSSITLPSVVLLFFKSLNPHHVPKHLWQPTQQIDGISSGFSNDASQAEREMAVFEGASLAGRIITSCTQVGAVFATASNVATFAVTAFGFLCTRPVADAISETLGGALDSAKDINSVETLAMIGTSNEYPLNGTYKQTADIDAYALKGPIGNDKKPFTGHFNGQSYTLENLQDCFVNNLEGSIKNIHVINANITSKTNAKNIGVVACLVQSGGIIDSVKIENSHTYTSDNMTTSGIVAGQVKRHGQILNTTVLDSTASSSASMVSVGICTGCNDGDIAHTKIDNCTVSTTGEKVYSAIVAGKIKENGQITDSYILNSKASISGKWGRVGIAAGMNLGAIHRTKVEHCATSITGKYGFAGIGTGFCHSGNITDTKVLNSNVSITGNSCDGGIGIGRIVGKAQAINTTVLHSNVSISGDRGRAGIAAGYAGGSDLISTTVNKSTVSVTGNQTQAGIGIGRLEGYDNNGILSCTYISESNIFVKGENGSAGIGAGLMTKHVHQYGTVSMKNQIVTQGEIISGIAAGDVINSTVNKTVSIDDTTFNNNISVNSVITGTKSASTIVEQSIIIKDQFNLDLLNPQNSSACQLDPLCKNVSQNFLANLCQPKTANLDTVTTQNTVDVGIIPGAIGMTFTYAACGLLATAVGTFSAYQWCTGYKAGLRGNTLLLRPVHTLLNLCQGSRPTNNHQLLSTTEETMNL